MQINFVLSSLSNNKSVTLWPVCFCMSICNKLKIK